MKGRELKIVDERTSFALFPSSILIRSKMEPTPFSTRIDEFLLASGASSPSSRSFSAHLDQHDKLAPFRQQFSIPTRDKVWLDTPTATTVERASEASRPAVYLAGNSLGLMPKSTPGLIQQELSVWATT